MDKHRKILFTFWCSVVCIAILLFLNQFSKGLIIETDILDLLPENKEQITLQEASKKFVSHFENRVIFAIGHKQKELLPELAEKFSLELQKSKAFSFIKYKNTTSLIYELHKLYSNYRYQLLSPEKKIALSKENGIQLILEQTAKALHSPFSGAMTGQITEDPFLLIPSFLNSLPKPESNITEENGYLYFEHNATPHILITTQVKGNAFDRTDQSDVLTAINSAKKKIDSPDIEILMTGALLFAARSATEASGSVTKIGVGSAIAVIVLILIVFKSAWPLLLGILSIGIGMLLALAISFSVFSSIHIITIGFGLSLIGICVDYSFHYFCELTEGKQYPLRHIFAAITLGLITSIIGYLGLFLTPFPGLTQMALFCVVGMIGAYGTVVCWYPIIGQYKLASLPQSVKNASSLFVEIWKNKYSFAFAAFFLVALFPGIIKLKTNDSIKALQKMPEDLVLEDSKLRKALGKFETSRYFIVLGDTFEEILQREERLAEKLSNNVQARNISFFQSTANFIPSKNRQLENYQFLKNKIVSEKDLVFRNLEELGFPPDSIERIFTLLTLDKPQLLTVEDWKPSASILQLQHLLLGKANNKLASAVILGGVTNDALLHGIETEIPGVHYVDRVWETSKTLGKYRYTSTLLILSLYILILLVLWARYGIQKGSIAMVPALLSIYVSLSFMGYFDLGVSLFTVLALLLVMGLGIDYTIFLAESGNSKNSTMPAVLLSGLSTVCAFGLLAISSVTVLKTFGITVLLGISVAIISAPLVVCTKN